MIRTRHASRQPRKRNRRQWARHQVEFLEQRLLLAALPPVTFTEPDGDIVTAKLSGTGTVRFDDTDDGDGCPDIVLEGTDAARSSLKISVKRVGNGLATLDAVRGTGLKSLSGKAVDVVESGVSLLGASAQQTAVTLHVVSAAGPCSVAGVGPTLDVDSRISKLTLAAFGDGAVQAPSIGSLTVKGDKKLGIAGDFAADITLSGAGVAPGAETLGKVKIAGVARGMNVNVVAGNIGSFSVGRLENSTVFAGFTPNDPTEPLRGGAFTAGASIASFKATGIKGSAAAALESSSIAADVVGTVSFASMAADNAGRSFGVMAGSSIRALTATGAGFRFNPADPTPQGINDFQVLRAVASPSRPDLDPASDLGSSATDNITRLATPTVRGTAPSGSTVELFDGVVPLGTVLTVGGAWSFTVPAAQALSDGSHVITARALDPAGNASVSSAPLVVTIDTAPPGTPTIGGFVTDTGLAGDRITSDATLRVTGSALANSAVELFLSGISQGAVTAGASGGWTLDVAAQADGIYAITATARDVAGNTSPPSAALVVTIDTQPPTLAITSPVPVAATNDNLPVRGLVLDTGPGVERLTVQFDSDPFLIPIPFDAAGLFDVVTNLNLDGSDDGSHRLRFQAIDFAGNVSASADVPFTLDTIAPTAPTISGFATDSATVGDGITSDATLRLTGTAAADSTVEVFLNGVSQGTVMPDAGGGWTLDVPAQADGTYEITADAQDMAGNFSTLSAILRVTIDAQPPTLAITSPVPVAPTNTNLPVQGMVQDAGIGVESLAVQFESDPFVPIFFSAAGEFDIATNLNLDGSEDGSYRLRFQATDFAGNSSNTVDVLFTLDTIAPQQPTFALDFASDTVPIGDRQTMLEFVTLVGQTDPNVPLVLDPLGTPTVSSGTGQFRFTGVALAGGANVLTVRARDEAGNESSFQSTITRVISPPVVFDDPDLAAAVRTALGLPVDQVITEADLERLSELRLDSILVQSLAGLEKATNLESIEAVAGNLAMPGTLSDFSPLAGLSKLRSLALVGAGLDNADLVVLNAVVGGRLETLDLRYNQITDLSPLAGDPVLGSLLLYGNPLTDLTPLADRPILVDLGPVELAQADTIAEVAAAFHRLPLDLYEYVLNNFEYQPYAGAMKGAQAALETGAGNDWDQASLLAALLGEAGVATRYVSGRIGVPAQTASDWLGVTESTAAEQVLLSAGLDPISIVDPDGNVVAIEFDHTWLEADLVVPGRGVQTVALDPSWKFKDYRSGVANILGLVPFDEAGYLSRTRLEQAHEFYETQVSQWLAVNRPGVSVADVAYDGPIRPQTITAVPDGLPYTVVSSSPLSDIPASMTHRVQLTLRQGATQLWQQLLSLPEMSLQRVTVSFDPAAGGQLTPQLRLDGQVVASGPAVDAGSTVELTLDHFDAGDDTIDFSTSYSRLAGQYIAVGLDANQLSEGHLFRQQIIVNDAALAFVNSQAFDQDDQIGGLLSLAVQTYFHKTDQAEGVVNALTHAAAVYAKVASGLASAESTVNFFPDLPNPVLPEELVLDIANQYFRSFSLDNVTTNDDTRDLIQDHDASAQEHAIWEEVANTESISTIKSLQLASERGIPVFVIDQSNDETFMPQLTVGEDIKSAIQAEIDAGATVTVPRDETPLNNWQGVGFITRSATSIGYIIVGGLGSAELTRIQGGYGSDDPDPEPPVPDGSIPNQTKTPCPCNVANGNVIWEEIDIDLPGIGLPLAFGRHYDSQSALDVGLGGGWVHSYSDFLTFNPDGSIVWTNQGGVRNDFTPDGSGGYTVPDQLSGTFTGSTESGFTYRHKDGMSYTFNGQGQLTEIRDRNANALALSYLSGRLATVTDADAPTRQLTFTFTGDRLTAVSDFTGRTWTYAYTDNRLTQVTSPSDANTPVAVSRYAYYTDVARAGLMQEITQPDGGTYQYDYYPNRRVLTETFPDGFRDGFQYDFFRQQTTVLDPNDRPTEYFYDDEGHMVRKTHADRASESFVWAEQLRQSWTDAMGQTETYQYDALDNLTRMVARDGIETLYTYEPNFNQVATITRPGGRVTRFSYDASGNLTQIEDALGNVTTMTRDSRGLVSSQTAPRGNLTATPGDFTTTFTYNDAGQVTLLTTDLPSTVSFAFDDRGNLTSTTDANSNTTTFQYDLRDRRVVMTDARNKTETFTYDAIGNLLSTTDELGRTNNMSYDLRQRLLSLQLPDSTLNTLSYDPAGNVVIGTDELGRATHYQHDEQDRPVSVLLPDGTSQLIFYDGNGRIERTVDARRNVTRFSYDDDDRLRETRDAVDNAARSTYDANGNLETTTDRRGAVTTYFYDLLDRVTQVRGPENVITATDYDADSNVVNFTRYEVTGLGGIPADPRTLPDSRKRTTQMIYDVHNRPIETIDPLNQSSRSGYDAGGRLISSTDESSRLTQFGYDAINRLVTITDALNGVRTMGYDDVGNLTSMTDELGRLTRYQYDSRDRRIAMTDALDGVRRTTFDAVGNPVALTDELGHVTRFEYDPLDRLVTSIDALNGRQLFFYDAVGNLTRQTDKLGFFSTFDYDALNRRTAMNARDLGVTAYDYDAEGNLIQVTDPLTHATQFTYDLLGRRTGTQDALGGLTATAYDTLSNVISFTDELNRTTAFGYDFLDRRISMTDPLNHTTAYGYDPVGNLRFVTDPLGHVTAYRYDSLDRRTHVIDANGDTTEFAYDAVGNRTRVTDPLLNDTIYAYDALNRLRTDTNELGASRTYAYDAASNLVSATDRDGRVSTFAYDDLNRRVQERWLNGTSAVNTIQYVYDAASQLVSAADVFSVYAYTYDPVGRMASVSNATTPGVPEVQFDYTYDLAGNLTDRFDSVNGVTQSANTYKYDVLNRMSEVTQNVGNATFKVVRMGYDAASQLTTVGRFSDAAATQLVASSSYDYDDAGRLTQLRHFRGATTLAQYDYTHDNADRITQIVSVRDGTSTINYDNRDQLTGADHSFQTDETYTYDDNGNRTSAGYQTGTNNRLLSDGVFNYDYDAEGNRIRRTRISNGEVTEYTWDHRNRLTRVQVRSSAGAVLRQADYTYDVFDRRIAKRVDADGAGPAAATTDHFVYDGAHIALQFDGAGGIPTHRYLHGPAIDQVFADQDASNNVLWALTDHQGTVRDLVDSTGVVRNHLAYDTFGRVTTESNAAIDFLFAYTGRERDEETGLHYYRARYYDPAVGRFVSEDPIGFAAGDANLSRYVGNGPVMYTDPYGLQQGCSARGQSTRRVRPDGRVEISGPDAADVLERLFGRTGERRIRVPRNLSGTGIDFFAGNTQDIESGDFALVDDNPTIIMNIGPLNSPVPAPNPTPTSRGAVVPVRVVPSPIPAPVHSPIPLPSPVPSPLPNSVPPPVPTVSRVPAPSPSPNSGGAVVPPTIIIRPRVPSRVVPSPIPAPVPSPAPPSTEAEDRITGGLVDVIGERVTQDALGLEAEDRITGDLVNVIGEEVEREEYNSFMNDKYREQLRWPRP